MFTMTYWLWIILGVALMVLEIFLPTFTALWIGAAAIVVGLVTWGYPALALPAQVLLWAVMSAVMTWAWFKFLKPLSVDKTQAGLSREALLGQVGQVLRLPQGEQRGLLRFPAPVVGDDEWLYICEDKLQLGDRVRVVDISGNALLVVKH